MKVGIVTFHRAENFGAVLQAYALQTYLQKIGCEVSIIDYRCKSIESVYDIFDPRIIFTRKNILKSLCLYIKRFRSINDRKICKAKYSEFRSCFFNMTKSVLKLDDIVNGLDCVISGSDQVWNLHLTGGVDENYFLGFNKCNNIKKISYAVSSDMDPCHLISLNSNRISKLLSDFDFISVREESFKDELNGITSKHIDVCLDPTFLLEASVYQGMSINKMNTKYVLVYHMTPIPEGAILAEKMAKDNGWDIIEIHIGYGYNKNDNRHKCNLGPIEILSYISFAEVVITSSFHGLALSLIMKKNVWVINKGNNLRQRNLLSSLNLEKRLLSDINNFIDEDIDYSEVSSLLDKQIEFSKSYINKALFYCNEKNSILSRK